MRLLLFTFCVLIGSVTTAQNTLSTGAFPDSRPVNDLKDTAGYNEQKTAACGTPWVSSGYPAWTNYWGGYQLNIVNLNASDDITVHSFEARFQGTSGYRIYTKPGTFVGFETNAAAWTLVGSIAGGLTGLGTTVPTPIPITVNICIPPGGTQAFYLTRTDNDVGNRHLYVPGSGTGGTTIYASDANLGITEAFYVTPFFAALYAQVRRPSLDVCYSVGCVMLPVELIGFEGHNEENVNKLAWNTASENDNDYFTIERSTDGETWDKLSDIKGVGNSSMESVYEYEDRDFSLGLNYYRLSQTDFNGDTKFLGAISINSDPNHKSHILVNLLGQEVSEDYDGTKVLIFEDGRRMLIPAGTNGSVYHE